MQNATVIPVNILVFGSKKTGKTIVSNEILNHPLMNNNSANQKLVVDIYHDYKPKIVSLSSIEDTKDMRFDIFDFIICTCDSTNLSSWKLIKTFLTQAIDVDFMVKKKICVVVSREDLKDLMAYPINEVDTFCKKLNIQYFYSNLLNKKSLKNLNDKVIKLIEHKYQPDFNYFLFESFSSSICSTEDKIKK